MVRWLVASCRTHFDARKGSYGLFFENAGPKDLKTPDGQPIKSYAEFRVDGPYIKQVSANEIWYDLDLNVLCHTGIDARDSDEIERMLGTFASAFTMTIQVMKFGDDRTVQVGCLILIDGKGEQIRVSRFGQANPDTKLAQASIDAAYRMKIVL